jgi:putative chitinase
MDYPMTDFTFDFTLEKFKKCVPHNKEPELWFQALYEELPKYNINTLERVAGFISQCQHESNDFTVLEENLNYSAKGLRQVFRKYFTTDAIAKQYERKKVAIANRAYANRMGNGDESSGDGWKYRGHGIIQITGKNNYIACSKFLFGDDSLVQNPDLLLQPKYAVLSACWYWDMRDLNQSCDTKDIITMTKRINGGTVGIDDRKSNWIRALDVLK